MVSAAFLVSCTALLVWPALGQRPGAPHVGLDRLPLRTEGRFIVDKLGERVKWACTNWYGPESISFAFGGFEKRHRSEIVNRISELGFNCVRVPYSLEAHVRNPLVEDQFLAANRDLAGSRFLDAFDAGIKSLTDAGLMVILDQHVSRAGYCCHWSQDEGLWYVPGYPEEVWIDSLVNMTRRYRENPLVVAFDLRNEVHDLHSNPKWGSGLMMTWGDGNPKTDWAAAATRAGNRVLEENKDLLIVVMALCFGMELRPMRSHPIRLNLPNRVVYQTHNYIEYQFWNLIPRDIGLTFGTLRVVLSLLCVVMAIASYRIVATWRRAGVRPPRTILIMSIGAWTFVFGLVFAIVAYAVYKAACSYCKLGASIDFLPWVWLWLAIAFAGAAASFCCYRLGQQGVPAGLLELESYALQSDASGDEDADDDSALTEEKSLGHMVTSRTPGLLLRLQCLVVCTMLMFLSGSLFVLVNIVDTYSFNERWLDKQWGFALEEGQPWTAPVWMGEFGYLNHGSFWLTFMRYLSSRDVDFAYWAINGIKFSEGFNGADGVYHPLDGGPRWVVELFGILGPDWQTVKKAWMIRDLQALMESPARWLPTDIGCISDFLGHFCDIPFTGPDAADADAR